MRIVSLYAGHTENLIAIGASDKLVACTATDDKRLTGSLPRLPHKPGLEMILALKPDLVLIRPMQEAALQNLIDRLKQLGVKTLSIAPPAWDDLPRYLELLGSLCGKKEEAVKAGAKAVSMVAAKGTEKKTGRPGVLLIAQGRTLSTCTGDSWAAKVIELAGGYNAARGALPIAPGSSLAALGAERLLALNDKIDVVILQQGSMNRVTAEQFMADKRFASMRAVKARAVYDIDEADISRPSLLRLEAGVEELHRILLDAGRFRR